MDCFPRIKYASRTKPYTVKNNLLLLHIGSINLILLIQYARWISVSKKNIYRNKVDFAREEFATAMDRPEGLPKPREVKSQKAQFESYGTPGMVERKDKKTRISDKLK